MQATIKLKDEILKKLESKSIETGLKPEVLANELLDKALSEDNGENMIRLADKFHMLVDIGEFEDSTNAVELRDQIRERKI